MLFLHYHPICSRTLLWWSPYFGKDFPPWKVYKWKFAFSFAFLLGFIAREAISAEKKTSKSSSCESCDPERKSFLLNTTKGLLKSGQPAEELTRKLNRDNYERKTDLVFSQSQLNTYLVTKPPKVYNLSDLVPPSFYIPIDNKDYSSQYLFPFLPLYVVYPFCLSIYFIQKQLWCKKVKNISYTLM